MNDRFKFRVWDKINDKWLKATLLDIDAGYLLGYYDNQQAYKRRYVLQQCTGLKDKNGKLIYEGDVVKIFFKSLNQKITDVVEWDNTTARFKFAKFGQISIYNYTETWEVIGNIYENPELLEVSE